MVHPLHVGLILKEFYYIRSYAFLIIHWGYSVSLGNNGNISMDDLFPKTTCSISSPGKQKRRRKSIWTPFRHFIVFWIRMIGTKCHLLWDYNSDQNFRYRVCTLIYVWLWGMKIHINNPYLRTYLYNHNSIAKYCFSDSNS